MNKLINEIPRRADQQRHTNAEKTIQLAIDAVEAMGADARLTDAVVLLGAAKNSVADFIDGLQIRRLVTVSNAENPLDESR